MGGDRFRLKPCTLAAASISLLFASPSLWANPTAPQVVSGQVSFQQPNASVLNVTNSPGAIINWQGFSIGASEVTRFVQQSAASSVLNRVTGGNISQIYGQLLSNGRVFLINPGGIVVGPGAIVDTAGFAASTLNMLDGDFLAGKLRFQGDSASGSIINQGWIRTGYGGHVLLVAPNIENSGLIHTPGGELILAAGQKVTMATLDLAGVQMEVQAPTDSVLNVGKLLADGGAVGVFAGTLRHSGEIRANSLVYDTAGQVVLQAQKEIQLAAGSATSADGKAGGSIKVQSGGSTSVAGAVSATGSAGPGGSIQLLGSEVGIFGAANVDASGTAGGGRILVGGDYQGANPAIQNSTNTYVGSGTTLRADATQSGDGGRIIVWSDDKAQFYGSLSAQGGPAGGNGGIAEVSGKQGLVFEGGASLGAPNGALGNLLLDPLDLYVFAGGGLNSTIINSATSIPADFPSNAATVSPATLAAISGNVTLQASRYMRISDPIALTTAGQSLTATVGTYTTPALPDPLALSSAVSNRLDLGAGITTNGGAVSLTAPTIQNVASPPTISIATSGGAISLNSTGQISGGSLALNAGTGAVTATNTVGSITLGAVTGSTFTANAPGSITTSGLTTTGNVSEPSVSGNINVGTAAAGSGTVALSGDSISGGTITTTGAVNLTATSSFISTTVNSASSLTATSPSSISINSSTDLSVASVTAGTNSSASLSTTGGSIRGTSGTSTVRGLDVTLQTNAGTGGGIGTLATALNVDVARNFSFRPNGDFNILLTGTGPIGLTAQLTPASSGTYSGTLAKQGGSLTMNASADTATVTVSNLNITSGFDQTVFFNNPFLTLQTTNGANLVATTVNVPTGDTVATVTQPNGIPFPVSLQSAGNLTLTSYTRAPGGLAKSTSLNASGTVTLGTIDASKDLVSVQGANGIIVGSLISTGNISLTSSLGAVNASTDSPGLEVSSGGAVTISGRGIGTSAFTNPFDLAGTTVSLSSFNTQPIGGANPVLANTTNLTVSAGSGSTFNLSTGPASLTDLNVTANPAAVGAAGTARVSTAGGADVYQFVADASNNFTFNPPASTGRNLTFASTTGSIALGATSLGTGNLSLATNNGAITTSGASISAASVNLSATTDIDLSTLGPPGSITASTGAIALHARNNVITGALDTPGALTIDGCVGFCSSPAIALGAIGGTTPPSGITVNGGAVTVTGNVTGAGDVTMTANGALAVSGSIITADGKAISLTHSGVAPFQFSQINAGATGTVNITSFGPGIEQTADGGASDGITAKTVSLFASSGPMHNTVDSITSRIDLLGTTNLTLNTSGLAKFDMHGSTLTDLTVTKNALPAAAPFELANLAVGQSVVIQNGTSGPLEVGVSSATALNFSLDTSGVAGTAITLQLPTGISSGGGDVSLTSGAGIGGLSSGPISSGAGSVTLQANSGSVVGAGITTTGGSVDITSFGGSIATGAIATGGGAISLDASTSIDVSGNLAAAAGSVTMFAGTSIARSGAFSVSSNTSVSANAFDGDIGTSGSPMLIASPTISLTANKSAAATAGTVYGTLTGTQDLTVLGDNGFNLATDTALTALSVSTKGTGGGTPGTSTLNLTAPTQTFTFARPATDLFGASAIGTFEVVSVSAPGAGASFTVTDGALLVRGTAGGPNKIDVANLTLNAQNGADILLQGNSANPLVLSNANQVFNAAGLTTADLLIHGKVALTSAGNQTLSASGNITINADAGGGGGIAITAPSQTFTASGISSKMEFLGGAAANESVVVTSTNSQFVQTTSTSPDSFKLLGGSGPDSSVTFTHSGAGAQTFQMSQGTLSVAGGSGANSFAKLEETGTTNTQRICFQPVFGSCQPIVTLNVLGGSGLGAFAQLTSAGAQNIGVSGAALNTGTTVKGGTGDGANALIQAATSQNFFGQGRLLVQGQGGPGAVAKAEILSGGSQTFGSGFGFGVGTVTVQAGASNGSLARIAATGNQSLSASATLTLIAQGTEAAPLSNASAIIEGGNQSIVALNGITLNAGAGTASTSGSTSDAVLRNLSGSQNVNTPGILLLDGGHQFSTAGILNQGTGTQIVSTTGGITLRSDTDFANPHSNAIVTIQNQPATAQIINTSGPLKLSNSGGGTVDITTAGDQSIFAQYIEVLTNPTTEIGPNSAKISAAGTQHIFTSNLSTTGFPSLRVAALGTGAAGIESLGAQLIELDYPALMQATNRDGRLVIGDVNAVGTSRVRAGDPSIAGNQVNQTIFAKSIEIQSGATNSISELKATGAQVITTLQGGIDVTGGSGNNTLAQIDPITQTILANGTIFVEGGTGTNSIAQIVAASGTTLNGQTILTTNGNIQLTGGAAGSAALITNSGSSSFVGTSGSILLTPGSSAGADAIISVANGPGTLTATCGSSACTLPPAGATPTGGILANQSGSSSSSTSAAVANATSPILIAEQTLEQVLIEVAPEGIGQDQLLTRRAPGCR